MLPECFSFLGRSEGDKFAAAEVLDDHAAGGKGPVMQTLAELVEEGAIRLR